MEPEEEEGPWHTSLAQFRICAHRYVAVFPEGCDSDNMECPACHHMTSEAIEEVASRTDEF